MLEKRLTKFSWVTYLAILLVSVMSKIKKSLYHAMWATGKYITHHLRFIIYYVRGDAVNYINLYSSLRT